MKKVLVLLVLAAFFASAGCSPVDLYGVTVDQRSMGQMAHDKKIKTSLQAQFLDDDTVKFLDISPYVYLGKVYLVGEYESEAERDRAVELAKATEHVVDVTTYLFPVKKGDLCGTMDGLELTTKVKAALIGDDAIYSTNVDVTHVQCTIVLLGLVGTQAEIDKAIEHAKAVEGVRGVKSFLKVFP